MTIAIKARTVLPSLAVRAAVGALLLAILAAAVAFPRAAEAGKTTDSIFPTVDATYGSAGGEFLGPWGIAVNQASPSDSQDGWIYVVDSSNHRIQAFDSSHAFRFAVGRDVVGPGGVGNVPNNKRQLITVSATGGTFTLTTGTPANQTAPIPFDAAAAVLQGALEATPTLDPGDVAVSGAAGGPWTVEFEGAQADRDDIGLSAPVAGNLLTGGAQSVTVGTIVSGADSLEICTVAAQCKAGLAGPRGGMLSTPDGIDVDQATGHFYVRDAGNRRVQEFTATGGFVKAWGADVASPDGGTQFEVCAVPGECLAGNASGTGGGLATQPGNSPTTGIAVVPPAAPGSGNVLVADPGNRRFMEFDPDAPSASAVFLRGLGWDVDPSGGGGAFEICTAATGCQAAAPGVEGFGAVANGRFSEGYPRGIAVDSKGRAYVSNRHTLIALGTFYNRLDRFDLTAGTAAATTAPGNLPPVIGASSHAEALRGFEIDPDDDGAGPDFDRLYQADRVVPQGRIAEFDLRQEPPVETAASPHAEIGQGLEPSDVTFDADLGPGTGTIYATTTSPRHRVLAFDDDGAGPPGATIDDPPAAIGAKEATFSGTADPQGFPGTTARFEVSSDDGSTWTPVGAPEVLPTVSSSVAVTQTVSDLTPATTYRARLKVTKPYRAGTGVSAPTGEFETTPLTPTARTLQPRSSGPGHVTLAGTVNPNGNPTTYRFEYTDAADFAANGFANASRAPVPDASAGSGGGDRDVTERIQGLVPSTTYFYRLVATSSEGTATGDVHTVKTTAADHPAPSGRAYEMVTPPFKVTRSTAKSGQGVGNNPNIGQIAVDGESILWQIDFLPLTDEVGAPGWEDTNLIRRSSGGWVSRTLNTASFLPHLDPTFSRSRPTSGNSTFSTLGWSTFAGYGAILPSEGDLENRLYTRRDGTGSSGFTAWVDNPERQQAAWGLLGGVSTGSFERTLFNDAATAMARSGTYRGLAEDPGTAADEDPSEQQLHGTAGGSTLYVQRADDPDALTGAEKDLAGECTGSIVLERQTVAVSAAGGAFSLTFDGQTTGAVAFDASAGAVRAALEALPNIEPGDVLVGGPPGGTWTVTFSGFLAGTDLPQIAANGSGLGGGSVSVTTSADGFAEGSPTRLPTRRGQGSATDTIATRPCGEAGGAPLATGTGVRSPGSNLITSLDVTSGGFAAGQLVSGVGIRGGTTVTATAPGQLTLSTPVACGEAAGEVRQITAGSPVLIEPIAECGRFALGQTVQGPGIPAGASIVEIDREAATMTLSAAATATSFGQPISVSAPATTTISADTQHIASLRGAALPEDRPTALSDTGSRVFFETPSASPESCAAATGPDTDCPRQLFVREYDEDGQAQVRWISHSRSQALGGNHFGGPLLAGQRVGELGHGIRFEGASRDGGAVYFRTDAPLTPDDPNGGQSITAGTASASSWDLYRYELPDEVGGDPEDGSLTRVSGGPSGSADPGTNEPSGIGGALRYLSDDGERAYFLTSSPIAGADTTPPQGGGTSPAGAVGNASVRNLYLFDASTEPASFRFVAAIPYYAGGSIDVVGALDECASSGESDMVGQLEFGSAGFLNPHRLAPRTRINCVHGTPDGQRIVFATQGRLTADDTDDAGDVYLYDAVSDELTRVSAPPADADPYVCQNSTPSAQTCNGDLGSARTALAGGQGWGDMRYGNVAQDANGTVSVFFESRSQLVPEDANGTHWDVYRWSEGELSLVSPGNSEDDSWYSGNGIDGRDVFFTTTARIDPREIDEQDFDIYDARVGGGFPYSPPPPPCDVLGHQCRPAVPAVPEPRAATTTSPTAGNVKGKPKPRKCRKGKVRRKGRCVARGKQRNGKAGSRSGKRKGKIKSGGGAR